MSFDDKDRFYISKETKGLILDNQVDAKDWVFGGVTGITGEILQPNGQWDEYLPEVEVQRSPIADTMSCVTFSALNCIEVYYNKKYGVDINLSDRFTAIMSGTSKRGNTMKAVAESIRSDGVVIEEDLSWNKEADPTWDDYHGIEISESLKQKALNNLLHLDIRYEWVRFGDLQGAMEALKYGPISIAIYAYGENIKGIYQRVDGKYANHVLTLYGYKEGKYWKVFDHYENAYKKLAWDYGIYAGMKYSVNLKTNNMDKPDIANNTLVQEVKESGEIGMVLDGKILVGDIAEVIATVMMRSESEDGYMKIKEPVPLTKEQWDSFTKINI